MANIYVRKILRNEMTIEEVPEYWREQVEEILKEAQV